MNLVAALALALMPAMACAAPDRISVLLGSNHIGAKIPFEQVNPGVFLTWERAHVDWTVGAYRNSFGKMSASLTAALPLARWHNGELSAFAGAALYPGDGYTFAVHAGDLVPIGGLQVRQGRVFMQVIPSDGRTVDAIVTFGLTFPLKPQR